MSGLDGHEHMFVSSCAMTEHQYEARCVCGNRWRLYRIFNDDDAVDDDPSATCIDCGADTYDLTDVGEKRSAGRDMQS